jgi:apolipoprotein N-acyltransferase
MRNKRRLAPALAAAGLLGLLHAASLSLAGLWWLQLGVFGLLTLLIHAVSAGRDSRTWQRASAVGFSFGLGWFLAGVCWLFISMHRYGAMPAPLAALALFFFCAYLAAFPALAAGLSAALVRPSNRCTQAHQRIGVAVATSGAFTLAELLRGWLFTGFPWLAPGYAHTDGPFAGLAPMVGVFGITLAACACASLLALSIQDLLRSRRPCGLSWLTAAALAGSGLLANEVEWAQVATEPLRVDLVQGNVAQDMKFNPERLRSTMQTYANALQPGRAQLTVLPETAWTLPWSATPPDIAAQIRAAMSNDAIVAIGMPLLARQGADRITNSVAVLGADGAITARYDKIHLVPFGEFIPWGFRWFVAMMNIPLGDFGRGATDQALLRLGGHAIAFNICYEDLFGDELARHVRAGANILINVSNIAWFGDSHAQEQHLQIARMRSLELARPTLRATNTGVTAAIDHRGRVLERLPGHQFGTLSTQVHAASGLTPFARWANGPAWILALILLAGGAALVRRS